MGFLWVPAPYVRAGGALAPVLRRPGAHRRDERIPAWVDREKIVGKANGKAYPYSWTGNYMALTGLETDAVVTVTFPMVETVETYYLQHWDELDQPWHTMKEKTAAVYPSSKGQHVREG
jgi:hypothetical protein